eukprot:Gregarina_sp_Poly_1__7312@NODE_401_length_8884_cov_129_699331_g327_i0_p1_GENE_NODE_401_length_8884_cov_129_699331_g327_i0NODE_401_length_8884_cov_129_699331_g327_i0_p1_ORF_typecomplete_len2342_score300_69TSP_1/PF00090_19/0_00028TSP_1/PF00090_19/6_5e13TSP_1/PF00090_19/3e07TSP_1/PF00090_19/6_6e07TSP_1/PF00090_19/9_3e11TSP_1/PF00090_19/6_7e10TSP_1/PF00090_19/1_8e04TSP_1/PF00090_19/1_8e04Notch/PF00066_17/1_6e03Notch/PF00066_17/1_2e03Notch/PF00066_17/8_1e03Notch/PF00066_17/1_2e04Notch/PF00066_17/3_2e
MGPWMPWSRCSSECGIGTTLRSRVIEVAPVGVAAVQCGPVTQVAPCFGETGSCAQDCLVSDWSPWSACSRSCGEGFRKRQRRITQHPVGDGETCPALEEVELCNSHSCAIDCLMSEWTPWDECDTECASQMGQRRRQRSVIREASFGGKPCSSTLEEVEKCSGLRDCGDACELGGWTDWSPCNVPCGEGVSTRRREVLSVPIGLRANDCDDHAQSVSCFQRSCAVDCEVTEWSEFDECSASCGGGEQKRVRDIIVPAANGGTPCPPLWDIQQCNVEPCSIASDVDCVMTEWSAWTKCSQDCGGGVKTRTRTVSRLAGPGGKACGSTRETKGCNLQRCADSVCGDNPRIESQGVTCQILKTQGCATNLMELARTYGVELPAGIPPEARVQDACPMTCAVCDECAPGCELRDLGNTVCTPECNVEECDFDRGDCGGDCVIGDISGAELTVQPPVTALQAGQDVKLFCPSGHKFSGRESLNHISVVCDGEPLSLRLIPTPDASTEDEHDPLETLKCHKDTCAYIRVDGFESDLSLFNGFYARDRPFDQYFPNFYRRSGRRFLSLSIQAAADEPTKVQWIFAEADPQRTPAASLSPSSLERVLPDIISDVCPAPSVVGGDVPPDCAKNWLVALDAETTLPLHESLSLQCFAESDKDAFIASRERAKTSTKIPTGPGTFMPSFCEDIRMVSQLSGYTCGQMQKALGCHLPLRDTGHSLPAFIPKDASVAFVCPETCDQCELCSEGCSLWFLGNGYCDPDCNNPDCNFDEGDCVDTEDAESRQLESAQKCQDHPLVQSLGFSCELLKTAAAAVGGCNATLVALAESQGLPMKVLEAVPDGTRVLDACPVTCDCCECERLLGLAADPSTEMLVNSFVDAAPCADSDLVYQYSKMTCAEISFLLKDCDVSLGTLGYLPEGIPDTLLLSQLCPLSCGKCFHPDAPPYECHDFSMLESLSGFSCAQAINLLGKTICARPLSAFGYAMPAAVSNDTTLAVMCAATCEECRPPPLQLRGDGEATLAPTGPTGRCEDGDFVFDVTGFECHTLVESGAPCYETLEALGYLLPSTVPASATLAQACPRSCNACPMSSPEGVCEDSRIVTADLGTTCDTLIAEDGCATLLAASSVVRVSATAVASDWRVGDLCRLSCGYCQKSSGAVCQDHPLVASSGYSCSLFLQFASDGCRTPLQRLLGRGGELPPGVPSETTIQDACPKTCQLCADSAPAPTAAATLCEDSPVLAAVSLSCAQVIAAAGGEGRGCIAEAAALAGSTPMADLLPPGMLIRDLCPRSCFLCGAPPNCSDGYQNGNETGIDCGGSACRPCRLCSSAALKFLPEGMASTSIDSELFAHGSQRVLSCAAGYSSTAHTPERIICHDGSWSTPVSRCEEATVSVWKSTVGLTHGEDFDFTMLLPVQRAVGTLLSLVYPEVGAGMVRLVVGGSCAALNAAAQSQGCRDNPLVAQMGFGCSMLAGLGCDQSLANLAAMNGSPLPPGLPRDALVSDACPETCDACETAAARLQEYLVSVSNNNGNPLGSDCFKAVVALEYSEVTERFLEDVLQTLGTQTVVNKLLNAAMRDAVSFFNTTVSTSWEPGFHDALRNKVDRPALSFILERPVNFMFVSPGASDADPLSALAVSDAGAAVSSEYVPFEKGSVTTHEWDNGLTSLELSLPRARSVFRAAGVSPSLDFYLSRAVLLKAVTPSLPLSASPNGASLSRRYFTMRPGVGALLGPELSILEAECEPDDDCCDLQSNLQAFLDGPCGRVLYAQVPSASELANFCRVPHSMPGEESCLSRALGLLHPYTDRSRPSCVAARLVARVMESWCDRDPWTGEFCLLSLETSLQSIRAEDLLLRDAISLDNVCHPHSCVRSHLKYVQAAVTLSTGWSLKILQPLRLRRRLIQETHETLSRSLLRIASSVGSLFRLPHQMASPQLTGHQRRLQEEMRSINERMLVPLDALGEDLLSLVCLKVNDHYCQQTSQLLFFGNPVENPFLVEAPCTSDCYSPVVARLGSILERHGRELNSPFHAGLGTLMTHYGRFSCQLNSQGNTCVSVSLERDAFHYPSMFNMTVPVYNRDTCIDCGSSFIGDGQCDANCFSPSCGFDGGDCVGWKMFPETLARLLWTACVSSITDPCFPLHRDFECRTCRKSVEACLKRHGCCYANAVETLRAFFQQQKQLMASAVDRDLVDSNSSIPLWYEDLELDRSIHFIEKQCGALLGLNCGTDTTCRVSVTLTNFLGESAGASTSRLLFPLLFASRRQLSADVAPAFSEWITEPDKLAALASRLHLLPSDLRRIDVESLSDNRTVVVIDVAAPLEPAAWEFVQVKVLPSRKTSVSAVGSACRFARVSRK